MRKLLVLIAVMMIFGFIITFFALRSAPITPDAVFINDAVQNALELDSNREMVDSLMNELNQAFNEMDRIRRNRDFVLQIFLYIFIASLGLIGVLVYLYAEWKIFMPFKKLQTFASRVAMGNFDMPLEMDKDNLFGAFTESFDLMREELRVAKENEVLANQSKKELVASLSHDIKTPVASIQSAMDLMLLKTEDTKDRKRIQAVQMKCNQINTLITDMFHATLEELQVLKVESVEISSVDVATLIHQADYEERITDFKVPSCLVLADTTRLQQVFDNIISNSYKYADTDIYVNVTLEQDFLVVNIQDFGSGVPDEEIPLLFNKFYRAKQVENTIGYGLGLYLARYFMEEMAGSIDCENAQDGFVMRVKLKLVG